MLMNADIQKRLLKEDTETTGAGDAPASSRTSKWTMTTIRAFPIWLIFVGLFLSTVEATRAQDNYPTKAIRIIVPTGPGGQFDIHARVLADKMKDILGRPVVVENKPGGATTIGANFVAQSKNDGYTLLFSGSTGITVAPHQFRGLAYKASDFQPISMVSILGNVAMINRDIVPVRTFAEFITFAKANPGKLSYGTTGTGSGSHMQVELMKELLGIEMTQVAYRSSLDVQSQLVNGQIGMAFDGVAAYRAKMEPKGPLRMLAYLGPERIDAIKDVPTFKELGYPQLTFTTWGGLLAPAGTPAPVIDKLHKAIVAANNSPEIRERVTRDGATPITNTPEEFKKIIEEGSVRWEAIIRHLNMYVN